MHAHGAGGAEGVKQDAWLEVQLPDGTAGVRVGQRTVPLDCITADTMPNEATLMNADANQGALQDLYARQVYLLVSLYQPVARSAALLCNMHGSIGSTPTESHSTLYRYNHTRFSCLWSTNL